MPELIEGKMLRGTAKAILMDIDGEQIWIPKGQIECMEGYKAVFAVSDWLACQKEIISESEFEKRRSGYTGGNQNGQQKQLVEEPVKEPEQSNIPF